jgi:4-methyl-5(b-hydroxyethyl)-thiazole monophosphate biosynthesis
VYVLLLAEGFEEVEAVTPADFLRRAGIDVRLVGVTGKIVAGNHGIRITADTTLEELGPDAWRPRRLEALSSGGVDIEGVIVPGGMPGAANIAASEAAVALIRRLFSQGKLVAAICAAPAVVLTAAGIVGGRRVTCFPGFEERFDGTGAHFAEDRVVEDGNLITSRGAGTAAEFAIRIIERIAGQDEALEVHRRTLQPGAAGPGATD